MDKRGLSTVFTFFSIVRLLSFFRYRRCSLVLYEFVAGSPHAFHSFGRSPPLLSSVAAVVVPDVVVSPIGVAVVVVIPVVVVTIVVVGAVVVIAVIVVISVIVIVVIVTKLRIFRQVKEVNALK